VFVVLASAPAGVLVTTLNDDGSVAASHVVPARALPKEVALLEADRPRWVWDDTSRWYPPLLAAGVRVERCVDLRLCHVIVRNSALTAASALAIAPTGAWDRTATVVREAEPDGALFDLDDEAPPVREPDPLDEFRLQREAVAASEEPARIGLLLAAESAGALIAAEMTFAGIPWRADVHNQILTDLLGPKPKPGRRPAKLEELLSRIRETLDVDDLNPDSPAELLKGLAKGGVLASSTRSWELKKIDHPVIAPLLEYKKLARLFSANGWSWVDTWVRDGRFKPDYVPGGVVTGRWATSGGGALQLPKQIRAAAVADEGWKLVVADAAQLEPRILAALSADRGMAEAGTAGDLYAGIVASGAVDTREHAKIALLGAMYGATTGESGRLMPKLARAYPKAIAMVEDAARAGENGEIVTTRLGRSSPRPSAQWREAQAEAYAEGATEAQRSRARTDARSWGRFTRNFIVQGSAAEWALCWMADLRRRLWELSDGSLTDGPHLVFFLHDEVVVHCPAELADTVSDAVRQSAEQAGRLLFGALPVEFPVTVAVVDNYGQAK
jgi:DNA polymerase-1